ncbi:MAG: prolipoprotein diacylglyceryl transferase [Deltaproteobacteria bacterium]|nr:prolipoprotein diacylglyceryl transferase [Deltaproteobacteria bacterium]
MFPEIAEFKGFVLHSWGVFVALGFLVGFELSVREARRNGLDVRLIRNLYAWSMVAAIVGSRGLFVFLYPDFFASHPFEVLRIWKGGMVFSGGLAAALAVGFIYMRRVRLNEWMVADIVAPGIALGDAIGRIGCLCAGCCYGKPTELPWAIVFDHPGSMAPQGIPLHPTQIYTSVTSFITFVVLWVFSKQKKWDAQVICLFLILHGAVRMVLESFRDDFRGEMFYGLMTTTRLVTLGLMAAGVLVWVRFRRRAQARDDLP